MIKQKDVEINLKVQKDERIIDIKVLENNLPSEIRMKFGRGSYNDIKDNIIAY